jgi:hypothetical protein
MPTEPTIATLLPAPKTGPELAAAALRLMRGERVIFVQVPEDPKHD